VTLSFIHLMEFHQQIYAQETPLGGLNLAEFVELVVREDVRPERPDDEDAPCLSDAIWKLAEMCWVKNPKDRPIASAVCDAITQLLDATASAQPAPNLPSQHLIALSQQIVLPPAQVQATPLCPLTPPPHLTICGHSDKVYCAAFSPDGKYISSGSKDCTVCVWDVQTGNLALGPLQMHTNSVYCVAFSPDGG
jgi:WD40 repeat protein